VFPLDPPHGTVTGANPVFQVGYSGIQERDLRAARFRIVLSDDHFRSNAYVFDQRDRRSGWIPGEPGRMVYRPRRPLRDGDYQWRVAVWNGVSWEEGQQTFNLRIDTVPPAPVEGLLLQLEPADGAVRLTWDPVALDSEGGSEFVARYHVYRYTTGPPYPVAVPLRRGSTPVPGWTDDAVPPTSRLVLYRVTAEDEAGNESSGLQ
jgi:hypothetical protein